MVELIHDYGTTLTIVIRSLHKIVRKPNYEYVYFYEKMLLNSMLKSMQIELWIREDREWLRGNMTIFWWSTVRPSFIYKYVIFMRHSWYDCEEYISLLCSNHIIITMCHVVTRKHHAIVRKSLYDCVVTIQWDLHPYIQKYPNQFYN